MPLPEHAGGFASIGYTFAKARKAGGALRMWQALASRNACKTCALGMGGQRGGMTNELGHFPEFCKKSVQAMAADMQPALPVEQLAAADFAHLEGCSPLQLETMGRLTVPLVAEPGADRYREATWDEAMTRIGGHLASTDPRRAFFYASGRSSNEAGFVLQLLARAYGTNDVTNCSFYCHQASGVGLTEVIGNSTATIALEDLDRSDLVLLIGGNPASNHPRLMRTLIELRRRGGSVVVVNPLRELGLERFHVPSDARSLLLGGDCCDLYLQPHIGGDIALLLGLCRELLDREAIDRAWLAANTDGWAAAEAHLRAQDPDDLAQRSGIARDQLRLLADLYVKSTATVFAWTMGITHHRHGTDNVRAICLAALARGMVGRPGAGLLPLRGHSNVQGIGTVGVAPKPKPGLVRRMAEHLKIPFPAAEGRDTWACLEHARAGGTDSVWCLGGNLFGASPEPARVREALSRVKQVVYLSTALNTGHIHGRGQETWILPVSARDEEDQPTTQESMFSYVRVSDGGPARHAGPRGETRILADLAARALPPEPVDWASLADHRAVRELIAKAVPGMERVAEEREFTITGRVLHEPRFRTPNGRAQVPVVPLPEHGSTAGSLRLMTIRSEGQFNTVVYEDGDTYRGQRRRDVVLLNPADMARLGFSEDQRVTVRSPVGTLTVRVRPFDVRPGNAAMYYPEANVLVPADLDPESRTPAFKHVAVTIAAAG